MIISNYQENIGLKDGDGNTCSLSDPGDDFTYRDFVDTVLYFWQTIVNFLIIIRNCTLLLITSNEKSLLKSTVCDKCFRGIQARTLTSDMSTPSTARSFNSLITKDSSVDHIRKPHKTKKKGIDVQTILYNQLKDLNILDSDINDNDIDNSNGIPEATHHRGDYEEGKTFTPKEELLDKESRKKDEIDPRKVAQYREAILKYSRISYSDFTSLFNKFVRENGRDFSKGDLLHWVSRFTKFIYLKKEISGEPTELREQLAFRAIQSKRKSLVDRLYTLREPTDMDQSLEKFCENLKNCYLNPIKKLLSVIRGGAGDTEITKQEETGNGNISSANLLKESNSQQTDKNDKTNIQKMTNSHINDEKTNISRTETLDLEQEKFSRNETGNDHLQQTTSRNRKKKTPKFHKTQKETERKRRDLIDFENMYQNSKFNFKEVHEDPLPYRDPKKLVNTGVYSTVKGYVRVSQYMDTTNTTKLENHELYQQRCSINSFIEYLDNKDPLPEETEVKPLPPGGLDEVLNKNTPPMDDIDYAEIERIRSIYEKENNQAHVTARPLTSSDADSKNSLFKGDPKVLAKELNDALAKERINGLKGFQDFSAADKRKKPQQIEGIFSPDEIKFNFASPGVTNPFIPEVKSTRTRERPQVNNASQDDVTKNQETQQSVGITNKDPGCRIQRHKPMNKELSDAAKKECITSTQSKEIQENNSQDKGGKTTKIENSGQIMTKFKDKKVSKLPSKRVPEGDQVQEINEAKIKNKTRNSAKFSDHQEDDTSSPDTRRSEMNIHCTDGHIHLIKKSSDQQIFNQLSPLNFIDTDDNEYEASESVQGPPVFLETNATVDYSRHAVEPSHGDRPNKKKLRSRIKEKKKTKGEANKHLKAKNVKPVYYFEDEDLDTTAEDGKENELEESVSEQNEERTTSSIVVYATDQPQILDNREYMMVPEEIIRITDPRLKDIEDKYSVGSSADKKDKKKRKEKKGKVQKNIPISFVSDFHI